MQILIHINTTTQEKQQQQQKKQKPLYKSVCDRCSRNLSFNIANMGKFKHSLIEHSSISPKQNSYQLKAHL